MSSKEHFWHYLILFVNVGLGLGGVAYFEHSPNGRFLSVFVSVLGYVVWGAWHHWLEKRLSWAILSEYLLIALVVIASASLILFPK